jgi:hypothetical protein
LFLQKTFEFFLANLTFSKESKNEKKRYEDFYKKFEIFYNENKEESNDIVFKETNENSDNNHDSNDNIDNQKTNNFNTDIFLNNDIYQDKYHYYILITKKQIILILIFF